LKMVVVSQFESSDKNRLLHGAAAEHTGTYWLRVFSRRCKLRHYPPFL
jgi:hypothetical protein